MNAHIFFVILSFLFIACSEENPAIFPVDNFNDRSSSSSQEVKKSSCSQATPNSSDTAESSSSNLLPSSSSKTLSSSSSSISYGELIDERDGHVYKTVKIGNQTWMAENLNYAYTEPVKMANKTIDSASFCYNNEPDSCAKYGRLYAWKAAMDCENKDNQCDKNHDDNFKSRGICPEKWHIPSVNEWDIIIEYANYLAIDLKSTRGWLDDGNGSDVFGFNLLPAGFYDIIGSGNLHYSTRYGEEWNPAESAGKYTCFWTQVQWTTCIPFGPNNEGCSYEGAIAFCISSKDYNIYHLISYPEEMEKEYALSVRCIKDSTEEK
jgi:uncharacterized protein (TIGR02145 family)